MANRNFPSGPVRASDELVMISLRATGAADVQANGYTLNDGAQYVASVARTAEGIARITLRDTYHRFLGASVVPSIARIPAISAQAPQAAGGATVDITFFNDAGAASDPDSAVLYIVLSFAQSSVG
jgi:hypothetical protein